MDIPSFLTTYGGPGGLARSCSVVGRFQSRKFDADRRTELREDIDREQADNAELRQALRDRDQTIAELRQQNIRCDGQCHREGGTP